MTCFLFHDIAATAIYTLSLHDALPIYRLIRDWHHPYKTYPAGSTFNAAIWASYLGANTTEKEFLEFYKSGRFKDRKSTRLNSSHSQISYAVFCLKKKTTTVPLINVPTS